MKTFSGGKHYVGLLERLVYDTTVLLIKYVFSKSSFLQCLGFWIFTEERSSMSLANVERFDLKMNSARACY